MVWVSHKSVWEDYEECCSHVVNPVNALQQDMMALLGLAACQLSFWRAEAMRCVTGLRAPFIM